MNKKILVFCFFVLFVSGVVSIGEEEKCIKEYVVIDLSYDGNFSVIEKNLEKGCFPEYRHVSEFKYSYELEGDNKSLYLADFNPRILYSDSESDEDIEGYVDEVDENFIIAVPSLVKGEKVNIYDDKEKILEIDIYSVGATSCRI
jgi:hypothetical protein